MKGYYTLYIMVFGISWGYADRRIDGSLASSEQNVCVLLLAILSLPHLIQLSVQPFGVVGIQQSMHLSFHGCIIHVPGDTHQDP